MRAAVIARKKLAREMIGCEVYEELPSSCSMYGVPPPPHSCWFVVCGPETRIMLDGRKTLLCISKKTGRILLRTAISSGG